MLRLIAFFKFEGRTNPEIAKSLYCSVRAVERKLRLIREILEQDAPSDFEPQMLQRVRHQLHFGPYRTPAFR